MKKKMTNALNQIDDGLIEGAMNGEEKKVNNKKNSWKRWTAFAAALALIITSVVVIGSVGNSGAVIALDVNPSIEIEVNRKEEVVEVRALNEDAKKVIGDMELKGVKLDVAVNAIIGSMLTEGYLSVDQNSILVSVDASDSKSKSLQALIAEKISKILESKEIKASVLTQSFEKTGSSDEISDAKKTLVSKIISAGLKDSSGVPYTFETLVSLKMNELKLILDSKGIKIDGLTTTGEASLGSRITKSAAMALALAKAGFEESEVTRLEVELDFEDDYFALVYEVEFVVNGNQYEYDILARGGEIVKEKIGKYEEDDDDNTTLPEGSITADEALAKALAHAGFARSEVKDIDIETDKENGVYVYEIDFERGFYEYEYTINAMTGEIIRNEKEFG